MEKAIELFETHLAPYNLPTTLFTFSYSCYSNTHTLYVKYPETAVCAEYFHIGEQLVRNYNTFIDLKLIATVYELRKEIEILKRENDTLKKQ